MGIVGVGVFLGGNCPGRTYPGGNFLWWKFSGWELSGGNHPGGNFPGGSFHVTRLYYLPITITIDTSPAQIGFSRI